MTILKFFFFAFFMMNFSLIYQASAQGRDPRQNPGRGYGQDRMPRYEQPRRLPQRYPQGRISCSASDRGWEEHWSGHNSCGDCLRHHGSCVEKCVELRKVCEVQGSDFQGRIRTYVAIGADQWSAESEARRQCEWDRNNRSCITLSCRDDNRTISTRNCR